MKVMLTNSRIHLGAEELIELGRPLPLHVISRQPFFLGRAPRQLGQLEFLGNAFGFLIDGIALAFTSLGNLLDVPLKILSQGVDLVFNGVADLLRNIPIVGDLLAEILVLGGSIIKFALTIPGMVLREVGNVLSGVAKALKTEKKEDKVDDAKDEIIDKAPVNIKDGVKAILDASGVTSGNMTPGVSSNGQVTSTPTTPPVTLPDEGAEGGIGTALAIGLPVIGGLVLLVALT